MFYTFDWLPFPGQPLFVLRVFVWLCRTKKDECRRGGSSTRDVRLNCINYGVWGLVGSSSLAAVDWDLLHYLTTLKHELIFPYLHQISVHYFRSMRRHECHVCCVLLTGVQARVWRLQLVRGEQPQGGSQLLGSARTKTSSHDRYSWVQSLPRCDPLRSRRILLLHQYVWRHGRSLVTG